MIIKGKQNSEGWKLRSTNGQFFSEITAFIKKKIGSQNNKKPVNTGFFDIYNGAYEIRTHGLNNANVARSQLRQCPIAVTIAQIARKCKVEICKKRLFYMISRC